MPNANPFIIGFQGDPTTWANPPAGKTAFGVDTNGNFVSKQSNGTITILNLATVSNPSPITNAGGVTTIGVLNPVTTQQISVTGSARNVQIVLSDLGAFSGCVERLKLFMPQTVGLVIQIYNGSTGGTLLYTFTTDATSDTTSAFAQFSFDGTQWNLDTAQLPAY